jgi:hypothetical protein
MAKAQRVEPRTYFLNEAHELTPLERKGGGGHAKFEGIPWATKGRRISKALTDAAAIIRRSRDPLKEKRFFLLAQPVESVTKRREDKKGNLKETYSETPRFGGDQGRTFDRLGFDLIQVTDDGSAVVHGESARIEQLASRAATLGDLGPVEQSRWAWIDSFETVPLHLRVDADWLKALRTDVAADVVIELQPVLNRLEADRVLRAIADLLAELDDGKLTGTGTDFSGRHWFKGKAAQKAVRQIAKEFYSVQAIHPPLYSVAAAEGRGRNVRGVRAIVIPAPPVDPNGLPCVAVVDLGIPRDHQRLERYRRGQFYPPDVPRAPVGDHGSFVASRVVFGDHETADDLLAAPAKCNVYDAMVGDFPSSNERRVNDKSVLTAMTGVRGAAPDVRVFNLSFGDTRHLGAFNDVDRLQKRLDLQHLDNFVFQNDALVIVAAGNSQTGVVPNPAYPGHHADIRWALGPWACGYNTLVCGAYVSQLSAEGLVQTVGLPSPFTRIGPGLCNTPTPCFCAPGGNTNDTYNTPPGMGVWGFSGTALAEDRAGTSYAAPILAREVALTLAELQKRCLPGTQPFGVTVRAFLTLTARLPVDDATVAELSARTLGHGLAKVDRLRAPSAGSVVLLWQGLIESTKDTVRVQLPIPRTWLAEAIRPHLDLVVCADPPVNEAAHDTWACRRIIPVLHPHPDARGVNAPRGGHPTQPVIKRRYPLERFRPDGESPAQGDMWLIELRYEEIAPYPPGSIFDPRQRVAFAAELLDLSADPVDPQSSMQALPGVENMTRLSIQAVAIQSPIVIRRN